ncbi:NUDIX domain-containing protein [Phlyctema vagabunda]|uniref:NUDIX domain-containing protein n=1 Tax=Phlyctema vagabunda TaxID=108571 RepID=A0ABR4P6B6_9HELO
MSVSDSKIIKTEPLVRSPFLVPAHHQKRESILTTDLGVQRDGDAKWTKLILTTYTGPDRQTRTWEHAERRSRPAGSEIDGVGIVAILEKSTGPELLLQKQYRPPVGKVTIEVPAGLVDAGESAQDAAVRELKEETGYVGVVSEESPVMFNDPGFCNTNLKMVHVTIDMELAENKNPKPQLEENEFIEVFTLKLSDLWAECKRLEGEGYAIDARVGTLAEGIEIAKRWNL